MTFCTKTDKFHPGRKEDYVNFTKEKDFYSYIHDRAFAHFLIYHKRRQYISEYALQEFLQYLDAENVLYLFLKMELELNIFKFLLCRNNLNIKKVRFTHRKIWYKVRLFK